MMRLWVSFVLVGSALAVRPGQAEPPGPSQKLDLEQNAALKYWRGFANLPRLSSEEQERLRKEALTVPLDAKIKDLIDKGRGALHELHNGANVPRCAWGVTIEDGMAALLPECEAARAMTTLAVLRMRQRFAEVNHGALDDAWATLKLGRDLSQNRTIIAVLVGIAIETVVIDAVAAELPRLDAATVRTFSDRVGRLPPMNTVAAAITTSEEAGGLDWFAQRVRQCKDRDELVKFLSGILGTEMVRGQTGEEFLRECGGTKEAVLAKAESARPFYRRAADLMPLPLGRFEKQWDEENRRIQANPVLKLLAPALGKCRLAEARLEARQKLWQAAVAVRLGGHNDLKDHPDPFGDGPFEYVPFDGGFELRSRLKAPDKPVTLTVGKRGNREVK